MRKTLIILLLGLGWGAIKGQTKDGVIAGRVILDRDSAGTGVAVFLRDTKFGNVTDREGKFTITNVPVGEYVVEARLVGYVQRDFPAVGVAEGETSRVEITLRQSSVEMKQVEITALRRQPVDDARTSVTTLAPRDAKYLPGAAEDVLRSLQSLPGVLSVSDFSSQLTIRGSGPDENLITIDGFEVINPYRLYGFVSMFNPETVNDISLQTGGFGVKYGDRLSAVLDVKNREGRSDILIGGKINSSLTNANMILEGALPFGGNWIVSGRRTYYDLVLGPVLKATKAVEGDVALPNFRDVQMKASIPVDPRNKILLNAVTSRDGVQLVSGTDRDRPDSISLQDRSYNSLVGLTWQYIPSLPIISQTQVSWYQNDGKGFFDGTFVDPSQDDENLRRADTLGIRFFSFGVDYDYIYTKSTVSQNLVLRDGGHVIEVGAGVDALRTDRIRYFTLDPNLREYIRSRGFTAPANIVATVSYRRYNLYVQDRIEVGPDLFVQPGLRFDNYSMLRKSYASPRFNISYGIGNLATVRAAFGIYYQSPGMEKQNFSAALSYTDETFRSLSAERAHHYVLGIDRMITPEWQFKVETYYKHFRDLIVPRVLEGTAWEAHRTGGDILTREGWSTPAIVRGDSVTNTPVNDATGNAYGIEFLIQKIQSLPMEKLTGWASYTLSFAERDRRGIKTPFVFDQRHAVNIVGNYRLGERWDLGLNFALRSGRPFARPLGVKPRIVMRKENGVDVPVVQTDIFGKVILDVEYERKTLSGRLDLYHTLDVRLTTYPQWWELRWAFYLDVTNIYNHKNEQQIDYSVEKDGSLKERKVFGLPVFPALGMSLSF